MHSVRLLTNNPAKVGGLSGFGVEVAGRVPLPVTPTPENLRYLMAKRDRLGHQIDGLPAPAGAVADGAPGTGGTPGAVAGPDGQAPRAGAEERG